MKEVSIQSTRQRAEKGGDVQLIAAPSTAAEKTMGFRPRAAQLLALFLYINRDPTRGCLVEINTGEGKSLIIAVRAAYVALHGKRVDTACSTENLAKRDAEECAPFYEILGLSVGTSVGFYLNFRKGQRHVYEACDVLYGDSHSTFEADYLRGFLAEESIASVRPKHHTTVDDVDSVLVDHRGFVTKITDSSYSGLGPLSWIREHTLRELNILVLSGTGLQYRAGDKALKVLKAAVRERALNDMANVGLEAHYPRLAGLLLDKWVDCAICALFTIYEERCGLCGARE